MTEAKPNHGSQRPHGEKALVSPQFKRKPALARQGTEDSRIFNYLFILFSIVLGESITFADRFCLKSNLYSKDSQG